MITNSPNLVKKNVVKAVRNDNSFPIFCDFKMIFRKMLLNHKIFRNINKKFSKFKKKKKFKKIISGYRISLIKVFNRYQIKEYRRLNRKNGNLKVFQKSIDFWKRSKKRYQPFIFYKFFNVFNLFFGRRITFQKKPKTEQKVYKLFCSVFGIGPTRAIFFCSVFGFSQTMTFFKTTYSKMFKVVNFIKQYVIIERLLRKKITENLEKKKKINMYSAVRIFQNLPSRGQRTKTNAKTAKSRRTLRLITSSSSTSKKTNTVNKPMKQPKNKVLNKKQKKK